MAQIDLKNTHIYIEDGYAGPGGSPKVNNGAGYAADAVTMTVDGFTGAVAVGDRFTVEGDDDVVHVISAHTETSSNTTSITFAPGLGDAVLDDADITMLPHQVDVTIGEGNITYDETKKYEYVLDRGILDTVREGDQEPVSVKMDFRWDFLKADSGDPPTVEDALKKRGEASGWVSSSDDPCEPYAVNIRIVNTPPCEDEDPEEVLLSDFRYETLAHDAKAGTVSATGKCNITEATVSRG